MHHIDLAVTFELALDGVFDLAFVTLDEVGFDGHAIFGGCFDDTQIANPCQRHMQGARDRRGRQGQHVDTRFELLEALFVAHPKALFFVDNQQGEVFELDVVGQNPVGANQYIDGAPGGAG